MSTSLGISETNCNECRRRKGKCDRMLPECTSCSRNRRHCLYETAAGRTPLTRKNLTEAEEKLRRAEMRARVAERRAIAAEEKLASLMQTNGIGNVSENPPIQTSGSAEHTPFVRSDMLEHQVLDDHQQDDSGSGLPEEPPSEIDDFSWDEISHATTSHSEDTVQRHEHTTKVKDEDVVDGMASLTVEERGAGYLGTSSGAAMLRLLMPGLEPRNAAGQQRMTNKEYSAYDNKDPAYEELGLADIDLDSAIDAYFASYHLQYPMVHEPTFRAQYSSIIPRPNGKAFEALVYMIGAFGVFSTVTTTDEKSNDDLKLFEAAKLNVKIDVLEKGNLTLLQVLVLMSNFLQKRGKPNRYEMTVSGVEAQLISLLRSFHAILLTCAVQWI